MFIQYILEKLWPKVTGFSELCVFKNYYNIKYYNTFPTGSVYGFGIKRRRRTATISESASNIKILHTVNKAGLFHILF